MADRAAAGPDAGPAPGVSDVDSEIAGRRIIEAQFGRLPPAWRRADRVVIETTHIALFAIGMVFTLMITLEVISRYVFSFSISFVNALARMLLVWFFLLGAGIALRRGAQLLFRCRLARLAQKRSEQDPHRRRDRRLLPVHPALAVGARAEAGGT